MDQLVICMYLNLHSRNVLLLSSKKVKKLITLNSRIDEREMNQMHVSDSNPVCDIRLI